MDGFLNVTVSIYSFLFPGLSLLAVLKLWMTFSLTSSGLIYHIDTHLVSPI